MRPPDVPGRAPEHLAGAWRSHPGDPAGCGRAGRGFVAGLAALSALLAAATATLPAGAATGSEAQPVVIERSEPRLYGYQLGDVIGEQLTIRLAPGYVLDPQSLPRAGKRAGWFLVRGTELHQTTRADGGTTVALRVDMQLTNSPIAARTLTVPAIALRFKGAQTLEETIPSLTIDAVPIATGEVRTGLPDVRPPLAAPLIDTGHTHRELRRFSLVALVLLAWLALALVLQRLRSRTLRPFAEAQRDLRGLLAEAARLDGARSAVQRLHRAFDQAAGHRLFAPAVPAFCRGRGADADLEARTVAFFTTSQALFFATGESAVPAGLDRELRELCRAWQRFEGRHP